jgi:hypothetical protein
MTKIKKLREEIEMITDRLGRTSWKSNEHKLIEKYLNGIKQTVEAINHPCNECSSSEDQEEWEKIKKLLGLE